MKNSSALPTNSSENAFVNTRTADYNIVVSICAVNVPFSLSAFLGNVAVLTAFQESSTHHSPTNILLPCLTVLDLAVGIVAQPLFMFYFCLVIFPTRQFLDVLRARLLATEIEAPEEEALRRDIKSFQCFILLAMQCILCYSSSCWSRQLTLSGIFLRYSELATSSRTVYIPLSNSLLLKDPNNELD